MLRHLQKRQKQSNRSDSDSDSDSDSNSDSSLAQQEASDSESQQETHSDSDSESDSSHLDKQAVRIPPSLLKALQNPIIEPNDEPETDSNDPESEDNSCSQDSTAEKPLVHNPRPRLILFPVCLICPGKQLKTPNLLQEHLKSQAHKRRLERYRDFIENPPPHTSLSPDPSEVVELIDALIGPPPVVPSGSINKKQKRKKRKLAKTLQETGKLVLQQDQAANNKKITATPNSENSGPTGRKLTQRRRSRRGKRERQESLLKNSQSKTS